MNLRFTSSMRFLVINFFLLLAVSSLQGQTWQTAYGIGASPGGESGYSACTDAAGNVYYTGRYGAAIDADPSGGTTTLPYAGSSDVFVTKYNSDGVFQWAKGFGGPNADGGTDICTDGTNVYVIGTFGLSATIGATPLTAVGGSDIFVLKLSAANGAYSWAVNYGSTSGDQGFSICLDGSGNPYILGTFNSSATIGTLLTANGGTSSDIFVAKLNPATGGVVWASSGGSASAADGGTGGSICYVPSLDKLVVGTIYTGAAATYGSLSAISNAGGNDICVVELNASTGAFLRSTGIGSSANDDCFASCYDATTGDVFISGYYNGSVTFPGTSALPTSSGEDVYIARYSPVTGNFIWAKNGSGAGTADRGFAICSDVDGVILAGQFRSTITFGSLSLTASGSLEDVFVVKYNASGTPSWVMQSVGNNASLGDIARGVAVNNNGKIFVTGQYATACTFGSTTLNAVGSVDAFFAFLNQSLSAGVSQTNLTCNGVCAGSASVTAIGGTAPYTYSWSPSGGTNATASGLCANNYTVTITDAALTSITKTFNITQPAAITATTSQNNVTTSGGSDGSASVNATGGTGILTYSWAPSGGTAATATGLTARSYTCTIKDANNCSITKTFTITEPTAPTLEATQSQTNVSCFGGNAGSASVTVTASNGTATYVWAPSGGTNATATGLIAGSYTCTITDNSTSITKTFNITQPASAVSGSTVVTNIVCFGGNTGAINLTPTGGVGPYTFNWGGGITTEDRTNLVAGSYSVTITDANSCTGTVNITVTQPASVVSGTTVVTNVACFGNNTGAINLTPTGGVGPYTFDWGSGITSEDRTNLTAGTYGVTITDANNCTATVSPTVTQPAAAVSGTTLVTNIACFGNNTGSINLTPTGGVGPYTYDWGGGITSEDRTNLTTGTYSVTITDDNGCTGTVSPTVTQPAAVVSGTTVVTNVACFGGNTGAINLTPTGGTGPYTFDWGGGITTEDRINLISDSYSVTITDDNGCTGTVNVTVTQPASVVSGSTVVTNVACNGANTGAINLTATGGVGPYTFDWGGSITTEDRTGLAAADYSVTITDANGCTAIVNATVTQPATAVSGTTTITNIACNGGNAGAINLTPTGGTGPYTFDWGGGITTEDRTNLIAGSYSVTITDANNCTGTVNATVTQPAVVSGTTVVTNVACFGNNTGSINLTPTGGTGPYTFNWGGGITSEDRTSLTAGSYSVTITDANNCSGTVNVMVTQPAAVVSGTTVVTNVACFGNNTGAINLTPTGGVSPYTYNWVGGATTEDRVLLTSGSYSVTITDANGCTGTVNATLTQPAAVVSGTTVITNVACFGGNTGAINLTPTGGVGPYTYNWVGGATTEDRVLLTSGTYSVTITDANGCTGTVTPTVTQPAAAVSATTIVTNVACFGNNTGSINLTPTGGVGPYTFSWVGGATTEDRINLTAGTYNVTITDDNGCEGTVSPTVTQPAAVVSGTTVVTNVSCFNGANGAIDLTPAGGVGPYTFNWGSGITTEDRTGLAAGTYSVTITDDNGCQATVSNITVTQPASSVTATFGSQTNVSCNGGSNGTATVVASGGMSGYTYVWSPSGGTAATATGRAAGTYTATVTDANGCQATQSFTITEPDALVAGTSYVNVSCNGDYTGTAGVTPTGGTAPYTYDWTPGAPTGDGTNAITGLVAGNYAVTITDANNCQLVKNFTLTENSAITATTSQEDLVCNNLPTGEASIIASGGTGGYSYSWSPSGGTDATESGLGAGNYTVTIKDNSNCSIQKTFTLTEPDAITATSTQTNVLCAGGNNGQATVIPLGGTGSYSYKWSPMGIGGATTATATGLSALTYTVKITDGNGCAINKNVTITQPPVLTAITAQTNILCGGSGTASVTAAGGIAPYAYSWSPSGGTGATATGLTAQSYTIMVRDNNLCTTTRTVTITQPSSITATQSQTDISCKGGNNGTASVTASGGTGTLTYSWMPGGGTAATASNLTAGNYTCTITDANGCNIQKTFTINEPAPLTATQSQTNVLCNAGNTGMATVVATGGTGSSSYSWSPGGGAAATANNLTAGNYTVTIKDANLCTITRTFNITQPTAVTATTTRTNISCNGGNDGTATVVAAGGTGGYTYSWAPGGGTNATATGLSATGYTVTVTDGNSCSITRNVTITAPTALGVTPNQTAILCNGGTATAGVTVTGGTGAYTYAWSPTGGSASSATLSAGNYTVTIKDANLCSKTQTFSIAEPTILTATQSQTNVLCNGGNGAAGVSVSGGTPGYSYTWSAGGSITANSGSIAAGSYTVTIKDANNCSITRTFNITQPAVLTTTGTQSSPLCNGGKGTAAVVAAGGATPYSYSWTGGAGSGASASLTPATAYTVTVTDANLCTTTRTFNITQPTALAATQTQTNVLCNGNSTGAASVTASGGTSPYTYSWTPNTTNTANSATALAAGSYTVTIKDANLCSITKTFTITQPQPLTAIASQTNVLCTSGSTGSASVVVGGGATPYSYSWTGGGGTAATATGLAAGNYTVTITDNNSCSTTKTFNITQTATSVSATISGINASCNGGSNGQAMATAAGGTAPYQYAWAPSGGTAATATGLAAGTYTVTVKDNNNCTTTQTVTLTSPSIISATQIFTNVTCNGAGNGIASVTATGGTGSYTYLWSPSGGVGATANGLAPNNYTVTIRDANNCSTFKTFTITEPTQLTATTTQADANCGEDNGIATITAIGGTAPYTYQWSPSGGTNNVAQNLAPGIYNWTVKDNKNCTVTGSITITQPQAPTLIAQVVNTTICDGDNTILTGTFTGANLFYVWEMNNGSGWNTVQNNSTYSNVNDDTLIITNATTAISNTQYRLKVITGSCTLASNEATLTVQNRGRWLGLVSTAWGDPLNWGCSRVPDATTDVTIDSMQYMPIVDNSTMAICNNLTINQHAQVTFDGDNGQLEIKGAVINNNGLFDASNGNIILSGNIQHIPQSNYRSLHISGGSNKVADDNVTISQKLVLDSGYIILDSHHLFIGDTGEILNASKHSFIVTGESGTVTINAIGKGSPRATSYNLFPVGIDTNSYTPLVLLNNGTVDDFTVYVKDSVKKDYGDANSNSITHNVVNKTWHIDEATKGGSDLEVTLIWNTTDEMDGFNRDSCYAAHFNITTKQWEPGDTAAAQGLNNMYWQTIRGITTLSPFSVGSAGSPLKVQPVANHEGIVTYAIYPNPVGNSELKIRSTQTINKMDVRIIDIVGRVWLDNHVGNSTNRTSEIRLDVNMLPPGIYLLEIKDENNHTTMTKFSKL